MKKPYRGGVETRRREKLHRRGRRGRGGSRTSFIAKDTEDAE